QTTLHQILKDWPIISKLCYFALYIIVTAFSLPAGALLTLMGGYLFGVFWGTTLTVTGATIGAIIIFMVARIAGDQLFNKIPSASLNKIGEGIKDNAFYFILTLRFIPVFTFWVVNIAPALVGTKLLPYATATFLGIIPGTFVFSLAGTGIGDLLAQGNDIDLSTILTGNITLALIALGLLSLLPPFIKWLKAKKASRSDQ
ncbi:MAG: VTT domain-containing protein, partial [Pseudomonadota bacterium]